MKDTILAMNINMMFSFFGALLLFIAIYFGVRLNVWKLNKMKSYDEKTRLFLIKMPVFRWIRVAYYYVFVLALYDGLWLSSYYFTSTTPRILLLYVNATFMYAVFFAIPLHKIVKNGEKIIKD